ncbi:MAG: hypothetical protein HFE88_04840 [Acutalibacter sp.]|nr:hypothetical protein [Acutalibacter sp.]
MEESTPALVFLQERAPVPLQETIWQTSCEPTEPAGKTKAPSLPGLAQNRKLYYNKSIMRMGKEVFSTWL